MVKAADIDKDGDIDVVTVSDTDDDVAWHENNGSQSFTEHIISSGDLDYAYSVDIIDLDQDGDMDILTGSYSGDGGTVWYRNNGSQSFTEVTISSTGVTDIKGADMDHDGDIDIVTGNGSNLYWFENNGSESFSSNTVGSLNGVNRIKVIDVDRDGNLDIVAGSWSSSGYVKWYESGAAPPTVSSVTSTTANGSYNADDVIAITITFSEAVTVSGTPQLTLETGSSDAVVNYTSGSGGTTLTFNYTVTSSHTSSDLDYKSTSALALNSGTINSTAFGAAATLTLASPGESNSLGANKAIVIDNTAPSTPSSLAAAAGNTSITLTWTANSESDLASYKVYGGTSASPTTLLSTISAGTVTYTNTSLTNGTTYYYRISAVDNAGNESDKTSDVSATPWVSGGNDVSGAISSNQTWTLAGSPFTVTGSVLVSEGVTLTIEAGVDKDLLNDEDVNRAVRACMQAFVALENIVASKQPNVESE